MSPPPRDSGISSQLPTASNLDTMGEVTDLEEEEVSSLPTDPHPPQPPSVLRHPCEEEEDLVTVTEAPGLREEVREGGRKGGRE